MEGGAAKKDAELIADISRQTFYDTFAEHNTKEDMDKFMSEQFTRGRLMRWPTKFSVQALAMWVLWMQFDGRRVYTEREVNEVLKAWHLFGDHCTLRRELINEQLLARRPDGSDYRKLPRRPPPEAIALMRALRERQG